MKITKATKIEYQIIYKNFKNYILQQQQQQQQWQKHKQQQQHTLVRETQKKCRKIEYLTDSESENENENTPDNSDYEIEEIEKEEKAFEITNKTK